jgi:hypothetical protein
MLRGAAVAIVIATFIVAGTVGATAIRGKVRRDSEARVSAPEPTVVADAGTSAPPVASPSVDSTLPPPPVMQEGGPEARGAVPLAPVIPLGQSAITDGVTALRADSAVTLLFDTPMMRTRIPEKFEQFVRTTLPVIYGHGVDSVLAKLPQGDIARQGDLTTQLPARGVRIPISSVWMLRLYPETRPGQDGPLVVRYRVAVVPAASE